MRIDRLGESAFILRELDSPAHLVAACIQRQQIEGILEAVPSYSTVGIYCVAPMEAGDLQACLRNLVVSETGECKVHTVPICYELGEDLADVSNALGISPDALIAHHVGKPYCCYALGFTPGFAYLGYVDVAIGGLARREVPRVRVLPGSVGIVGHQTGIYPSATPGGWHLIGRTPLQIADPKDHYFPISAGDQIQFVQIDEADFGRLQGERL